MTSGFDERAKERIEELINFGERVKASVHQTPTGREVDSGLYTQWVISSLTFLSAALGEDSAHYQTFAGIRQWVQEWHDKVPQYLGVLHAAKDDIESGWVGRRDLLLTADAFGSLLEQAEHLLSSKYKDAAAVLTGAVLESSLRKLCDKRGVAYTSKETMEPLNVKLAKDGAYQRMTQKMITTWGELRNNAAHGDFDKYSEADVRQMHQWVSGFVEQYLR
jgi:hypothetical protein